MIAQSTYHSNLAELAAGRELEILEQVAGIPHEYLNKKGHPCPRCGGKDRFSLIDEAKGTVFCRHCFNHGNRGYVNAVIHYAQAADYKEAKKMILEHLTGNQPQPVHSASSTEKTRLVQMGMWIYKDENKDHIKKVSRWSSYDNQGKQIYQYIRHNNQWVTKASFKGNEAEWNELYNYASSIPLNLPTILENKDETVFIVEGEKCCDILSKWERCVTTGSGGVNTAADWVKYLTGRNVVILPDSDEPGYAYALKTAKSLQGKAESIRVLFLPDLEAKEDIYDWIKKGNTKKQFSEILANTPQWDGKPFAYNNEKENKEQKDTEKERSRVNVRSYADIEELPVDWLLKDFIPLSMLTLLVGEAGEGKSFLTTWLSSMVSTEGNLFRSEVIPNGKIILGNSEDNPSRTIKPRLLMNGANMDHIYDVPTITRKATTIDGKVEYEASITLDSIRDLRNVLEAMPNCRLVIFDPVSAFWGEVNENKNPQVRVVMEQLKRIAEDYGVAIVLVTHYNKGLGSQALARITGSYALSASCRAVWSVTNNKETNIRTVACAKLNISENRAGFTFKIVNGRIIILEDHVDVTADEMLQERMLNQQKKRGPEPEKMNECCEWLKGFLAKGAVPASEIFEKAATAGYAKMTVDRAKKMLNIKPQKEHFSGRWMWSFSQDIQDNFGTEKNLNTFEDIQVFSGSSENLNIFDQSLENTGVESEILCENPQDIQVSSIYKENLNILGETEQISPIPTVATHCDNTPNNVTKKHSLATVAKHCGTPKKSPESDKTIITTPVEEIEERVNQILEERITEAISKKEQLETIKKERMDRINRQAEENLKVVSGKK